MNATLSYNKFFIKSEEDFSYTLLQLAKKVKWKTWSVSHTISFDKYIYKKKIKDALELNHIKEEVWIMKLKMVGVNPADCHE
ncbi:hypothetical protein GBA52_004342 [Prunus armeniaca]|nr:hypothetical protein GBA52_004342 [Prunus armeniaca]